jgi:hypothetical protein
MMARLDQVKIRLNQSEKRLLLDHIKDIPGATLAGFVRKTVLEKVASNH